MGEPTAQKLANLPEVDIWIQISEAGNLVKNQQDFYQPIASLRELAIAFDDLEFSSGSIDFTDVVPGDFKLSDRLEAIEVNSEDEDEETLLPVIVKSNKQVVLKGKGDVALLNPVSNYLSERVWKGV